MSAIGATGVSSSNTRSYDPNIVIRAAKDKLAAGDLVGGQTLFQSALLNWVDDAREGGATTSATGFLLDQDSLKEAIATLWIAYAHYLMGAKQFKSATEAFEQAIDCPVGGTVGRVWLEYVRFLEERNKPRAAQQIYLRALILKRNSTSISDTGGAVKDEQDRNILWHEFLELSKRTTNNPEMTLREFQDKIYEEHQQAQTASDSMSTGGPPQKRPRMDAAGTTHPEHDSLNTGGSMEFDPDAPVIRTHVVTPSDVQLEIQTLSEAMQSVPNDPSFMAAWLVRDGEAPPQPPHPSLFDAAPPKLSDPTGKDLLGENLALAVVQRMLEPSGGVVLRVCRALWMWALMKEKSSQDALKKFDVSLREEYEGLQKRLDERLSVAGAAEEAVRMMNEQERQIFETKAQEERQALLTKIAWDLRQLQWASQQVLNKLQMPGFVSNHTSGGTTVDPQELQTQSTVCAYLHSAFFLRRRIGNKAHETMLRTQLERLLQFITDNPSTLPHQVPPSSNTLTTPPMGGMAGAPQPPSYMPASHHPGVSGMPQGGYLPVPPPPQAVLPGYLPPPPGGSYPHHQPPRHW